MLFKGKEMDTDPQALVAFIVIIACLDVATFVTGRFNND